MTFTRKHGEWDLKSFFVEKQNMKHLDNHCKAVLHPFLREDTMQLLGLI